MRKLRKLFLAAVMFAGFAFTAQAQEVAHIDMSQLVPEMPDYKAAQAEIQKKSTELDNSLKSMITEFQTKMDKYQSEAETAGDALNATRGKEMQEMEQRIKLFQENAQKEIADKNVALMQPVSEKAMAAIKKVARAKGYKYVLDSSVGSGVMMADGPDLMADVKKELKMN